MGLQLQTLAQTVLFALLSVTALSIRPASDRARASIAPALLSHSNSESCGAQQFQTWLAGSRQAQLTEGYCSATCDDAQMTEDSSECWGNFRFFCKPPAGNNSCGFFGVKCDGHFASWHMESEDKVVAVCEGGLKSMGVKETVCPASGTMWRKFSASGCLGTSSTIMSKKSDGPPSPSDISPIFSRASARLTPGQEAAAARYAEAVRQYAEVDAVLATATEPAADGGELLEGGEGMFEGRCDGFSGAGKAVRKVVHAGGDVATADMMLFDGLDSMQASVHAALGDVDLPEAPPAGDLDEDHADLVAASSDALTAFTSGRSTPLDMTPFSRGAVECVVRCNGKPAWFAGMWPCWGNATLSCTSTSNRAAGQVQAQQAEWSHPDVSFSVTCKGVWTGFFGKVCMGLTLEHVHVEGEESSKEVHGICSGKHGVKTRKERDGFAMGEMCNGKSVVHAHVKHHDEHPEDTMMESAAIREDAAGEVKVSI